MDYLLEKLIPKSKPKLIVLNEKSIILVSPELINGELIKFPPQYRFRYSNSKQPRDRISGYVISGMWDFFIRDFHSTLLFRDFESHFKNGIPWDQTNQTEIINRKLLKNRILKDDFQYLHYLNKYDDIYKEISRNGYLSSTQLNKPLSSDIEVAITREGKVVLLDGKHRLAMTKILQINKIPVTVNVIHYKFYLKLSAQHESNRISPLVTMDDIEIYLNNKGAMK